MPGGIPNPKHMETPLSRAGWDRAMCFVKFWQYEDRRPTTVHFVS